VSIVRHRTHDEGHMRGRRKGRRSPGTAAVGRREYVTLSRGRSPSSTREIGAPSYRRPVQGRRTCGDAVGSSAPESARAIVNGSSRQMSSVTPLSSTAPIAGCRTGRTLRARPPPRDNRQSGRPSDTVDCRFDCSSTTRSELRHRQESAVRRRGGFLMPACPWTSVEPVDPQSPEVSAFHD
jgi:hypothetical protein